MDNLDSDLTITETARVLRVSRNKVYRLIAAGRLHPAHPHPLYDKHGPQRVPRSEVEALADLARLPKPKPPPS